MSIKSKKTRQAWWSRNLIPVLWRQRQADFCVPGQPGLESEFQDSQGYTEKPCLKEQKTTKQTNKQTKNKKKQKKNKTKKQKERSPLLQKT
jgi:hypothetical protein